MNYLGILRAYKCRQQGTKEWRPTEGVNPYDAAIVFAEEWGLDNGDVVQVCRHGKFRIRTEVEYTADKAPV